MYSLINLQIAFFLTLFRIAKKAPLPATSTRSTNVGINPQNFVTINFNPFAVLV